MKRLVYWQVLISTISLGVFALGVFHTDSMECTVVGFTAVMFPMLIPLALAMMGVVGDGIGEFIAFPILAGMVCIISGLVTIAIFTDGLSPVVYALIGLAAAVVCGLVFSVTETARNHGITKKAALISVAVQFGVMHLSHYGLVASRYDT